MGMAFSDGTSARGQTVAGPGPSKRAARHRPAEWRRAGAKPAAEAGASAERKRWRLPAPTASSWIRRGDALGRDGDGLLGGVQLGGRG